MRLQDKVAIVTGAASGIGQGIAVLFGKEGARLVISDINLDGLAETEEMIRDAGGEVTAVKCDFRSTDEVDEMVDLCVEKYGTVHILINVPAVNPFAPFIVATEEEIQFSLDVGVVGAFRSSKAVIPYMIENRYGKIVNITSIMSVIAGRGQSSYNAGKGALKMLTQGMALDLAGYGINVNAVGPGMVRTGMTKDLFANEERLQWFESKIPMGRVGVPEDIAPAVLFLSTDEAGFITGQTIFVDGGQIATA
jgi:NAD(P)-dependent dehydrogenase (short-subunit alcohol dehydrogenase family)